MAGTVLLACSGGDDSSNGEAGTEAGPTEAGDETVDCSGTAGTMVGAETDFPMGTWTLVQSLYVVAQDANGFYAYTAICTHQGCTIFKPNSNGDAICPCHGSEFDGNGKVINGPAVLPLQHFAVNICGGNVFVDDTMTVNASTRTPPQ